MAAELLRLDPDPPPPAIGSLLAANLPQALRSDLPPACATPGGQPGAAAEARRCPLLALREGRGHPAAVGVQVSMSPAVSGPEDATAALKANGGI